MVRTLRRTALCARLICITAVLVIGAVHHGFCADSFGLDLDEGSNIQTHVTADEIVYDENADKVTAKGDVVVDRDILHLSADEIRLQPSAQTASAEGDVQVTSGEDQFSGRRLELNWEKETGAFYDGTLFLKENNFHIQAEKIEKTGIDSYLAEDVLVTTCDGTTPAWEVDGKKLDITIGGYGKVDHALLKVKRVPVFYTPFLGFSVKQERQSGLLAPHFGFSDRMGFQISQPYYWATSDSADATVYADYLSRRGVKLGLESRYFLSDTDMGVILFDFLKDRKVDDGSGTSSRDWGYPDDRYLRPNSNRYWLRMKQDQSLGEQAALKLDLDVVSDQDYLYEFKSDYSGYNDSRNLLRKVFSRDLDGYNDTVRKNRLNFSTQWPGYSLNAEALWWDDVIARQLSDRDETVQSLPVVYFDSYKKPLLDTPLYAAFETQSAYLYREDGSRGGRIDLYPRIYLPYRLGGVLSIEPSLGGRETLWQMDHFDEDASDLEQTQHRELYDFELNLSSEINRVFKADWGDVEGLKHALRFEIEYDYTPREDQTAYPYFDGLDRIEGENLVTYGIVNTFTARRGEKDARHYQQVVRFELSQSYDVGRERDGDPKPFNPLESDLQLDFGNWCYLRGDASWSPYRNKFVSHNIAYRFSDGRGDRIVLQHRYADSLRESLNAALTLKLTDSLWLFSNYERNIKDNRDITRRLEAVYRAQCWSIEARYETDEEKNTSIGFVVTLYGLGDIGGSSKHGEGLPSWADEGF